MTREERKIKEDILKEIEIPNILDKVKPYANEKAAILQEDRKTVHLNFRRPARIFAACLACFIGAMIVLIVGISLNEGGAKFGVPRLSDVEYGLFDSQNSSGKQREPSAPICEGEPSQIEEMSDEELIDYCKQEQIGPQDEAELTKCLDEIKGYINDGKSLDEILTIYNGQDGDISEDFIKLVYNHLSK